MVRIYIGCPAATPALPKHAEETRGTCLKANSGSGGGDEQNAQSHTCFAFKLIKSRQPSINWLKINRFYLFDTHTQTRRVVAYTKRTYPNIYTCVVCMCCAIMKRSQPQQACTEAYWNATVAINPHFAVYVVYVCICAYVVLYSVRSHKQ